MIMILSDTEFMNLFVEASNEIDKKTTPELTEENKDIHNLMCMHNVFRDAAICAEIIKKYKSKITEGHKNG